MKPAIVTALHKKSYLMLVIRTLLAWTLYRYGWAKLTGEQFGVDNKTMELPLKDVDLMRLSWYLADQEPFKSFIGASQIFTAILISFNRTAVIGAFMAIPICLNILIWDLTFMEGLTSAFTFRLSVYLILTSVFLYYSIDDKEGFIHTITKNNWPKSQPFWIYLTLPVAALVLELIGALPSAVLSLLRSYISQT